MAKRKNNEDRDEEFPKPRRRVKMTTDRPQKVETVLPIRGQDPRQVIIFSQSAASIPVPEYMLEGWGLVGPDSKLTWLSLYYYFNRDI